MSNHLHTKHALRFVLLGAFLLTVLALFNPVSVTHAQLPPNVIVRNDGATFPIVDSKETMSPSNMQPMQPEQLVNTKTAPRNLPPLGGLSPESVIGPDGRTQVTNTTDYPNRAIAHLEVDFPSSSGTCTGWFIATNRLATAAHCLYDFAAGEWATNIVVIPGRDGTNQPYGSFVATNWYVPSNYVTLGASKFDYGVIKINYNFGNWFGYMYNSNDTFYLNRKATVRGYPGDKTYGTMWTMSGNILEVKATRLYYRIDTYGGQSGSPVYGKYLTCNPCSYAIHTLGGLIKNSATRITKAVFNFLQSAGAP